MTYRYRSQSLAYPFFLSSALLFALQVTFGLVIAAQFIWPTLWMDLMPFNIGRATHLNLLVFWLLLGLMGATYYLIPEETESEVFSTRLAYLQLGVLLTAGVGTLVSFWFFRDSMGKPFTESPMPWPWVIAAGAVLFLVNIGATILRAPRRTAIAIVLFTGMAGMSVLYLINMIPFDNLAVDYYFWWWIIHLWVEGTWELIAAAVFAFLLIGLTGVSRDRMNRWLYAEVALVLFTGIPGIGHHYYWIGTPTYWLYWGAVFSALEPIPLALMTYDALYAVRTERAHVEDRVTLHWVVGSAIAHFLGAGLWGLAITLPQINRWTHGTLLTAAHGHFAFFGAFAMVVLAAAYAMTPRAKLAVRHGELWSFWLMCAGMGAMVFALTIAGVVQVYLWRLAGVDFMTVRTQYVTFWMWWVWLAGLVLFLPGVLIYLRDLFGHVRLTAPIIVAPQEQPGRA